MKTIKTRALIIAIIAAAFLFSLGANGLSVAGVPVEPETASNSDDAFIPVFDCTVEDAFPDTGNVTQNETSGTDEATAPGTDMFPEDDAGNPVAPAVEPVPEEPASIP